MPTLALKVDAVVEGVLAIVLVVGALVGALRGDDFPSPVNGIVVALVGLVLIPVAVFLWRLGSAERVPKQTLRWIATANAVTALLLGIWLVAADGFSDAGRWVTAATVAALFVLAALQLSWSLVPQD
jgi:4-amino-4-deoxy-L-arabinose transferase-like glycosyltransferase